MRTDVRVCVNGRPVDVVVGSSVAAAIAQAGVTATRRSIGAQPRAPLCGMGVCFECRVRIDGIGQQRACMTPVRDGMSVDTDD
ncbi:(2Fe-2S)-binding protein [Pseudoxanthomonas beigongshangi]